MNLQLHPHFGRAHLEKKEFHTDPVHCYEPILEATLKDDLWKKQTELVGVNINEDEVELGAIALAGSMCSVHVRRNDGPVAYGLMSLCCYYIQI